MRSVKLITLKKIKLSAIISSISTFLLLFTSLNLAAQDNSPYSRYGLGDKVPNTNVANRGMGGVAAAYNDIFTVNYANPASYSFFQSFQEPNSKKLNSGRAVFNIGADALGRTLIDPNQQQSRFTSTNILFSHVMVGVPIRKNWGMALGLRPVTSISYKIQNNGIMLDPRTSQPIDSSSTVYEGQGGVYLGSLGTGVKFKTGKSQYLSLGVNGGYMFGKKDYSTRLGFYNDSMIYAPGNFQNKTSINGLYLDAGLQYFFKANEKIFVGLGAYGNWKQNINTSKDVIIETFNYSPDAGYIPVDTVYAQNNIKNTLVYPASVTAGFTIQKSGGGSNNESGWMLGADFTANNWDQFRYEGIADTAVKNNWQAKIGAEFNPARKRNYFSKAAYRIGFFTGPDYIYTRKTTLPVLGISGGLGLPLLTSNPQARNQASMINISFEYIKRGNNANVLKENLYRLSVGFSLTDLWFGGKTKYYE